MHIKRQLNMSLPQGQSAFLWGARKTGKSTFLSKHFPNAIYYDLLKTDEFTRLIASPHLLREELSAIDFTQAQVPVIIDEIQKLVLFYVGRVLEN